MKIYVTILIGVLLWVSSIFAMDFPVQSPISVQVPSVQDDDDTVQPFSTSIQIATSEQPVFQSDTTRAVIVEGTGFTHNMSLVLKPSLLVNVDYALIVTSVGRAELELLPGKKWRAEPGLLEVMAVHNGTLWYLFGAKGVHIAKVVPDTMPEMEPGVQLELLGVNAVVEAATPAQVGRALLMSGDDSACVHRWVLAVSMLVSIVALAVVYRRRKPVYTEHDVCDVQTEQCV